MQVHPEVAEAVAGRVPVVALESTLIAHGLPRGRNLEVVRDLAPLVARGASAATTVASTAHIAARAGIRVFATGGLGGVHRGARESWDESADLTTLASTGIVVVCAGVKSVLDVGATLERLETLGVTVLGYGTDRFPGFYLSDSGHPVGWRVDSAPEIAAVAAARAELGTADRAVVVANPLAKGEQLDPALHERVLEAGLAAAGREGVGGKDVTPFLLDFIHRETGGASLEANVRIVVRNAGLAGRIAAAMSATWWGWVWFGGPLWGLWHGSA